MAPKAKRGRGAAAAMGTRRSRRNDPTASIEPMSDDPEQILRTARRARGASNARARGGRRGRGSLRPAQSSEAPLETTQSEATQSQEAPAAAPQSGPAQTHEASAATAQSGPAQSHVAEDVSPAATTEARPSHQVGRNNEDGTEGEANNAGQEEETAMVDRNQETTKASGADNAGKQGLGDSHENDKAGRKHSLEADEGDEREPKKPKTGEEGLRHGEGNETTGRKRGFEADEDDEREPKKPKTQEDVGAGSGDSGSRHASSRPPRPRRSACEGMRTGLQRWTEAQRAANIRFNSSTTHGENLYSETVSHAIAAVTEAIAQEQGHIFSIYDPIHTPISEAQTVARPDHDIFYPIVTGRSGPTSAARTRGGHLSLLVFHIDQQAASGSTVRHYDSSRGAASSAERIRQAYEEARTVLLENGWLGPNPPRHDVLPVRPDPPAVQVLQSDSWTCGLHTIFNAWIYALGLEGFRQPVPYWRNEFPHHAIQIVELTMQGFMDAVTIRDFLQCHGLITQDVEIPSDRGFDRAMAFRSADDLSEVVARARLEDDLAALTAADESFPGLDVALAQIQGIMNGESPNLWQITARWVYDQYGDIRRMFQVESTPPGTDGQSRTSEDEFHRRSGSSGGEVNAINTSEVNTHSAASSAGSDTQQTATGPDSNQNAARGSTDAGPSGDTNFPFNSSGQGSSGGDQSPQRLPSATHPSLIPGTAEHEARELQNQADMAALLSGLQDSSGRSASQQIATQAPIVEERGDASSPPRFSPPQEEDHAAAPPNVQGSRSAPNQAEEDGRIDEELFGEGDGQGKNDPASPPPPRPTVEDPSTEDITPYFDDMDSPSAGREDLEREIDALLGEAGDSPEDEVDHGDDDFNDVYRA